MNLFAVVIYLDVLLEHVLCIPPDLSNQFEFWT